MASTTKPPVRILRSASKRSAPRLENPVSPPRKRARTIAPKDGKLKPKAEDDSGKTISLPSANTTRKLEQLAQYSSTSPFSTRLAPSAEQCQEVTNVLAGLHGMPQRPIGGPRGAAKFGGCGDVPSILDALVRTTLSQNTTSANSTRAHQSLIEKFGPPPACWDSILASPLLDLVDAIRCGGLAQKKANVIRTILAQVKEKYGTDSSGFITLDHLHEKSDNEVMEELVAFNGVGPKTASCVLLFCMERSSFAVDTHVFRLSKALGWIPPDATREQAFHHLDARIPDELKYPLHVLLIQHGKSCSTCAARGRPGMGGWKAAQTVTDSCDSPATAEKQTFKLTEKQESKDLSNSKHLVSVTPTVGCPLKAHGLLARKVVTKEENGLRQGAVKDEYDERKAEVLIDGAELVIQMKEEESLLTLA